SRFRTTSPIASSARSARKFSWPRRRACGESRRRASTPGIWSCRRGRTCGAWGPKTQGQHTRRWRRAMHPVAGTPMSTRWLGCTYVTMFNLARRRPIGEFTDRALAAGTTAVMLDDEDPWGHLVVGLGHARRRRPELALQHLSQSIELNPSFALGHAGLGYAM